jgi:hypothetical protein
LWGCGVVRERGLEESERVFRRNGSVCDSMWMFERRRIGKGRKKCLGKIPNYEKILVTMMKPKEETKGKREGF